MSTLPVTFDEEGNNGLVLSGIYVPLELLVEIFNRTHYKALVKCQIVCKCWRAVIHNFIWRKKAERIMRKPFLRDKNVPWDVFYYICKKKPFEKNLIKNPSGGEGERYWMILSQGGDCWKVESPPVGVPRLPQSEPMFKEWQSCFTTSYYSCTKIQVIDMISEGFTQYTLDVFQPPITVSEWYSCRWDCPAIYECEIKLLGKENGQMKILDTFKFRDNIEGDRQNQWLHVSHVFENYGTGLKKISFLHGGMDKSFWAGHYGSKMAGACIFVKIPSTEKEDTNENK